MGPIDRFGSATDFARALEMLVTKVDRIEVRKTFVDGSEVCTVYSLVTNSPAGTARCTDLARVENGKITSLEVFVDATAFRPMFEKHA